MNYTVNNLIYILGYYLVILEWPQNQEQNANSWFNSSETLAPLRFNILCTFAHKWFPSASQHNAVFLLQRLFMLDVMPCEALVIYNEAVCNGLTSCFKFSKVSVTQAPVLGGSTELCLISVWETTFIEAPEISGLLHVILSYRLRYPLSIRLSITPYHLLDTLSFHKALYVQKVYNPTEQTSD